MAATLPTTSSWRDRGHQETRRDGTALAGMRADGEGRHHGGQVGVGIIEHDEGRLAAQFQEHLLDRGAGHLHDPPADRGRAGEADHVHLGVTGECLADRDVGRGQDVDHPGRDVSLGGDQLSQQEGLQRSGRCCLEDHGASGGQRRSQLGQRQLGRVVVGDDRGDHPCGLFLNPARCAAA